MVWGASVGWSCPAEKHLNEMVLRNDYVTEYAWTLTITPLAGALGVLPYMFFTRRIGPKKTMIVQAPLNALCWFLLGFRDNISTYHTARFFASFFSIGYLTCGQALVIQTVHRKYQKLMYSVVSTSMFVGVFLMNALGLFLTKHALCMLCTGGIVVTVVLLFWIPESPVYLMRNNPLRAKKSLEWYRGHKQNGSELDIIYNYVHFTSQTRTGFISMFKSKAVLKAILICTILFILKAMSGYYALVMDSRKWFKTAAISTYTDNMIFSCVLIIMRFLSSLTHLYGHFGIRKPLLWSTMGTALILALLGYYIFYVYISDDINVRFIILPALCLFCIMYEVGLSNCPEITLYDYLPCQVYEGVSLLMITGQYILVFIVSRVYLVTMHRYSFYVTLWILSLNLLFGFVFIYYLVIESFGKSLAQIQIEMGGNPIGTRGSRRQRIANPMDHIDTNAEIKNMVVQGT